MDYYDRHPDFICPDCGEGRYGDEPVIRRLGGEDFCPRCYLRRILAKDVKEEYAETVEEEQIVVVADALGDEVWTASEYREWEEL